MVLPVAVTHNLKAILVLGALCVGVELAGCGSAVQANPPNSRPPAVSVSLSPTVVSMQVSKTQEFSAVVQNDTQNKGVIWSLTQSGNTCAPGCGSVSSAAANQVIYTAPSSVPNPAIVTLTSTSVADNTKSASSAISVTAPQLPISVYVSAVTATIPIGTTQLFTATLQNDTQNKGVTWSLTQSGNTCAPGCGSLAATAAAAATYDAPASVPNAAIVTLTATSVADNTKSDSATITITVPPVVFAATVKFCDDETEDPNCISKNTFSLAQIRDLFIWMNWQGVSTGTHTQELDIFMPQGHALYVKYSGSLQITGTPKGSATVMSVMPVAGTWITQRQFTGTWEVDVLLDGKPISSKQFDFTP
jgi:hypothetical protein